MCTSASCCGLWALKGVSILGRFGTPKRAWWRPLCTRILHRISRTESFLCIVFFVRAAFVCVVVVLEFVEFDRPACPGSISILTGELLFVFCSAVFCLWHLYGWVGESINVRHRRVVVVSPVAQGASHLPLAREDGCASFLPCVFHLAWIGRRQHRDSAFGAYVLGYRCGTHDIVLCCVEGLEK